MTYVADASVAQAKRDVGFHEGGNNSNPYSEWQYGNRHNPWCNSACAYWAYVGGFRFWPWSSYGEKGDAYVPYQKNHAITAGVWRDKWWRAAPGDFVCFDWEHNGVLDHIEMVIADDGNKIVTIGGNTSNGVYYRTRDRNYVGGFVALSEAGQSGPPPAPPVEEENMLIKAPARQTTIANRPACVYLDRPTKQVRLLNGAKVNETNLTIPSSTELLGWFESPNGSGFTVIARKPPNETTNPAYHFTWKA